MSFFRKLFGRSKPDAAKAPSVIEELSNDYGFGYVARQLPNGEWCLWDTETGKGCDLVRPRYKWKPGSTYWHQCVGSRMDVHKQAPEILTYFGHFEEPQRTK